MQTTVVALPPNEVWWYDSDTATVPIAIGNSFATPVLNDTTTYYLEARYQDDTTLCVSPRSAVTVYVIDTAGLTAIDAEAIVSGLAVYPNPADDYLIVESDGEGPFVAEIYDLMGGPVSYEKSSSPARLDVSYLTPGQYFLKVTYRDGKTSVTKFIKQ
jgi:hypothetical protein